MKLASGLTLKWNGMNIGIEIDMELDMEISMQSDSRNYQVYILVRCCNLHPHITSSLTACFGTNKKGTGAEKVKKLLIRWRP